MEQRFLQKAVVDRIGGVQMKLLQKSASKNGRSSRGITRNDCKDIIAGEEVRANKNEQPRKGLLTNNIRDETPKSQAAAEAPTPSLSVYFVVHDKRFLLHIPITEIENRLNFFTAC